MASITSNSAASPSPSTVPTSIEPTKDDHTPTVKYVSSHHFAEIEREREKRRRKFRLRRYSSESQILIITLPSALHEALHLSIYRQFEKKLIQNNQDDGWVQRGSTTFRVSHGHPGGDIGEGDSTGSPRPERNKNDWPTLVIEAGDSESLGELRNDMRWWFSMSDHQVKIVLLAKFDHACSVIILEKWEEEAQACQGTTTTRSFAAALRPILRQSITIAQNTTTDPISYKVARGALILSFRLLFLRDPGPGEADFGFSVQDLQHYAACVWWGL
ncbi:hypothetical protein QBC42DRAFT_270873 [Cladorrhinum samala]|uniref:Uncharacterized protein n=1 Tax=Cladorrhinum samala TaxID=585594 RepID=A0AAV9HJU5_9PEZI|nr:hypothetical protein QBC42DRAFT_270873 [Cladorrhinum samala]